MANAFAGANLDNRSLPGVYIGVVMGRHAGFLTAASIFGKKFPDDGPHLIYVPEKAFDTDKFLADVDRIYKAYGRCIIAVSEGIGNAQGEPIITTLTKSDEKDAHGNVQLSGTGALGDALGDLIKQKLKIKRVRSDTFGYLQRCFLGTVSAWMRARRARSGEKAVQYAVHGQRRRFGGNPPHRRLFGGLYSDPARNRGAESKSMPDEFIDVNNSTVTDAFKSYARPLVGDMAATAVFPLLPSRRY